MLSIVAEIESYPKTATLLVVITKLNNGRDYELDVEYIYTRELNYIL